MIDCAYQESFRCRWDMAPTPPAPSSGLAPLMAELPSVSADCYTSTHSAICCQANELGYFAMRGGSAQMLRAALRAYCLTVRVAQNVLDHCTILCVLISVISNIKAVSSVSRRLRSVVLQRLTDVLTKPVDRDCHFATRSTPDAFRAAQYSNVFIID